MSWFTQQWAVFTPTGTPTTITDTPSAQRSGGPDGTWLEDVVLTDSPAGLRFYGPSGSVAIGVVLTDTPSAKRDYGPDGTADIGVTVDLDSPSALRAGGPDGTVSPDLVVTDRPSGIRFFGAVDGVVALGVVLTDTPSAERLSGPDGTVQADSAGAVTVALDPPSALRDYGPDGVLAIGLTFGDLPSGIRFAGPDGIVVMDVILTDTESASRYGGPDGLADPLLGDTPGTLRASGADGAMGIDVPVVGATPSAFRLGGPSGIVVIGIGAATTLTDSPSASRYGGPDGMVLLAFLPSKPPYIPIAPLIAPSYSLWIADTVTGRMLWSLPMDTMSWDIKLNDIGSIRASLVAEDAWDALSDQNERDPRVMLREILSGSWRFCLVVKWGNNVVWAGPYLSFSRSGPNKVELNGAEIQKIFSRRVLVKPGATAPTDVSADTVMGPAVNKRYIAGTLVNQAMSGTGRSLPINVTLDTTSGIEYRTYFGYDLANYWDKLHDLMNEVDGPEVRFDPKITQGSDANYLSWDMQIGTPHLGRGVTPWIFDSDVNSVVGLDTDGSNIALQVWSAGNGQSRDKLIVSSSDTTQLAFGWPLLEAVDNSHSSETLYGVLAASNSAQLQAWKKPAISFKTVVPADVDPMVGSYRVGEDFSVDVRRDPIIPDGLYSRRIAGLAGTEKPWVTITDIDPLAVGAT